VDDITELKLAREKLQNMLEALELTQSRLEGELAEAASYVRSLLPARFWARSRPTGAIFPARTGGDGSATTGSIPRFSLFISLMSPAMASARPCSPSPFERASHPTIGRHRFS